MEQASSANPGGVANLVFVLLPRFNAMNLTTVIEPFRVANYLSPEPLYEWEYLSVAGGMVTASNGMTLETLNLSACSQAPHIVFVCGSWGAEHFVDEEFFGWLRRQARSGSRIAALELGIYALARAGLLSDRKATTHWSCMAGFAEQFPSVNASEQLYTMDGPIITCAGGTAGLDLALSIVATEHGDLLAAETADQVIHYPVRPAESVQRRTLGGIADDMHPIVLNAISQIEEYMAEPLTMPELSRKLGVSQRSLERLFRRYLGCSAVQFSQLMRLQYARVLLTSTELSIRDVSAASGFNSLSYFSQAFSRCFGRKPSAYRRAWPTQEPAPSWPGTLYSFVQKTRMTGKPVNPSPV